MYTFTLLSAIPGIFYFHIHMWDTREEGKLYLLNEITQLQNKSIYI